MSWRDRAKRFKFQVSKYESLSTELKTKKLSAGKRSTTVREMVFLQESMKQIFREITEEINPSVMWQVTLEDRVSQMEILLKVTDESEAIEYIDFLNMYRSDPYKIKGITPVKTRFSHKKKH